MNVTTVVGRQKLIAHVENVNAGLHQLDLHVSNLDKEVDELRADNRRLRQLCKLADHHEIDLDLMAKYVEIVNAVWGRGESIYSPEIQALVANVFDIAKDDTGDNQ